MKQLIEIWYNGSPRLINLDHVAGIAPQTVSIEGKSLECTKFQLSNGKEFLSHLNYARTVELLGSNPDIKII